MTAVDLIQAVLDRNNRQAVLATQLAGVATDHLDVLKWTKQRDFHLFVISELAPLLDVARSAG